MDGKGSWRDNVRMERFWRTYKYELFNLYDDVTQKSIEQRLKTWISYYNSERLHSSLGNKTPEKWREEHQSVANKLGLTINAINSNLTTAPSIGSEIP